MDSYRILDFLTQRCQWYEWRFTDDSERVGYRCIVYGEMGYRQFDPCRCLSLTFLFCRRLNLNDSTSFILDVVHVFGKVSWHDERIKLMNLSIEWFWRIWLVSTRSNHSLAWDWKDGIYTLSRLFWPIQKVFWQELDSSQFLLSSLANCFWQLA